MRRQRWHLIRPPIRADVLVCNAVFGSGSAVAAPPLAALLHSFMVDDCHIKYVISLPFPEIPSIKCYSLQKALPVEYRQEEVRERGKIPQSLPCRHKITIKIIT